MQKESLLLKDRLLGIYVVVLLFSSGHTTFFYHNHNNIYYLVLFCFLVFLLVANGRFLLPTNNNFYLSICILLFLFVLSELFRFDLKRFAGWSVVLAIAVLLWSNPHVSKYIIRKYVGIIVIISTVSLVFSFLVWSGNNAYNAGEGVFYQVFLSYDSTKELLGMKIPRLSGHIQQASLVPAYFLLPLGVRMMMGKTNNIFVLLILLFSLFVMSSSVYIYIFLSIFIYMFFKLVQRVGFIPFFLFFLGMVIFSYIIGLSFTIEVGDGYSNNLIVRTSSGISRLVIMSNQIMAFFESPFIGYIYSDNSNINLYLLGSMILGAGVRVGIIGVVFMLYLYYLIINNLSKIIVTSKQQQLGVSMIYSAVIMMMSFQDFGFSSTNGYIFLFLTITYLWSREGVDDRILPSK